MLSTRACPVGGAGQPPPAADLGDRGQRHHPQRRGHRAGRAVAGRHVLAVPQHQPAAVADDDLLPDAVDLVDEALQREAEHRGAAQHPDRARPAPPRGRAGRPARPSPDPGTATSPGRPPASRCCRRTAENSSRPPDPPLRPIVPAIGNYPTAVRRHIPAIVVRSGRRPPAPPARPCAARTPRRPCWACAAAAARSRPGPAGAPRPGTRCARSSGGPGAPPGPRRASRAPATPRPAARCSRRARAAPRPARTAAAWWPRSR